MSGLFGPQHPLAFAPDEVLRVEGLIQLCIAAAGIGMAWTAGVMLRRALLKHGAFARFVPISALLPPMLAWLLIAVRNRSWSAGCRSVYWR
ncbi:MAG: hypothetical protein EXR39_15895 [Betaproteobacteria bacterium]|nr:hypothetical protein [Betaproteobacteria bacterium]